MREGSIETKIARFLFAYRITPHGTTGLPPSVMLMGRRPRSLLDLTYPELQQRVRQKQLTQKQCYDRSTKKHEFDIGDKVYILSHNREAKWFTGTIIKRTGPNQIRHKYDQYRDNKLPDISEIPNIPIPSVSNNQTEVEAVSDSSAGSSDTNDNSKSVMKPSVATPRPTRTRKPPNRYVDFVYK
ncbi:unnamed protein product [Mytilus coruscus]|uniref:Integrase catalytic domain-containing protein n=1 Tax=Mytilus coruscus TaxID=42192 RepID=A0A6J8ERS8_MYTCO|nr:unnamed protein product [Mytilus coruscus]